MIRANKIDNKEFNEQIDEIMNILQYYGNKLDDKMKSGENLGDEEIRAIALGLLGLFVHTHKALDALRELKSTPFEDEDNEY